jgi:tripartite-type tricarboxylate transporter receptor subunit TctC
MRDRKSNSISGAALPDVREKMTAFGLEIHTETPAFFAETIRSDFAKWGKLARDIGFKPR